METGEVGLFPKSFIFIKEYYNNNKQEDEQSNPQECAESECKSITPFIMDIEQVEEQEEQMSKFVNIERNVTKINIYFNFSVWLHFNSIYH